MSSKIPAHIKTIKYKVTATIVKVKISKKLKFYTKVQWKRHQNIAQTQLVPHQNGISIFNQQLILEFSFHYDTNKNCFLEKKCDMMVVIDLDGNGTIKNGGYARFDLVDALNDGQQSVAKQLILAKNPDPQAHIQFNLLYQPLQEIDTNQLSVMNTSSYSLPTNDLFEGETGDHITISEAKEKTLEGIVVKFEKLASKLKQNRRRNRNEQQNDNEQRLKALEKEIEELKASKEQLQIKFQESQFLNSDLNKKIFELQKSTYPHSNQNQNSSNQQYIQLQNKYHQQSNQIFVLKSKMAQYQKRLEGGDNTQKQISKIKQLQNEKIKLQKHLADKSNQIGQLFNAALQIGGAELLDKLQSAIGLIEQQ